MSSRLSGQARSFAKAPHKHIRSWLQDGLIRRLLKNSGWLLGGTTFATAIGLISLPLKTHALGAAQFGLLTVVLAYVTLMERLTAFSSWVPLIKFGSAAMTAKDSSALVRHVKLAFLMDGAGAVLGFALALSGAWLFATWQGWDPETIRMLSVASLLILFNLVDCPTGILRIFDRFRGFTIQKITEASVGLAGTLLVLWMDWGIWGFLLTSVSVMACSRLLLLGMALLTLRQHGLLALWGSVPLRLSREFLTFGGWSYLSRVMDIPVKQLDVIILSATLSLEASGIYRIVKQVVGVLILLVDPIYQAVYPQLSVLVAKNGLRNGLKYCLKIGVLITLVVAPISFALSSTSYWWLGHLFGPEFRSGWAALSLFLALKVFTLPTIAIHLMFTAAGYVRKNTFILASTNALYLLLLWKLSVLLGLFGPVVAWFIQSTATVALKVWLLLRPRPPGVTQYSGSPP